MSCSAHGTESGRLAHPRGGGVSCPQGNLYLVGPMGSGKSTVGRRLAAHLDMQFRDCDEEIEQRTGASVNLIFDIEGERGFREREARMLEELAGHGQLVVATGGGAVLRAANRELMRRSGFVVWLNTGVAQQVKRLELDKKRPLLQTPDWKERLQTLARERDPLYREVANLVFDTHDRSVDITARALATAVLEAWQAGADGTRCAAR